MAQTIPQLRKQLTPCLGKQFFRLTPRRVVFLVIAYAVAVVHFACTGWMLDGRISLVLWFVSLIAAINTGSFFFFFMHEVLHGGVFRSRVAIAVTAFLGGIPCLCSPYVWRIWHNHHHRHTSTLEDTDRPPHPAFDDVNSLLSRLHDFTKRLRYSRIQSYFVPFFVLSGHHLLMLIQTLIQRGPLKLNTLRACTETFAIFAFFFAPLFFLDVSTSVLGIYLPLVFSHLICNLYILTNHFDNPLSKTNCPLLNSTSVYLSAYFPWTHMGFGRHVEHHIYPQVTHDKLADVTVLLRSLHPEEFHERWLFSVIHSIMARASHYGPIHETS